MNPTVAILAASEKDDATTHRLVEQLGDKIEVNVHIGSAHKNTKEVLASIDSYKDKKNIIFVTIAGRSNALSGVVAGNTHHPVIALPPFNNIETYMVDIHSTLRMPSNVPVLVATDPDNCALAIKRLFGLGA